MASANDTFTDSAGTALTAHTPDSGGSWTEHTSYSTGENLITDANRVRGNTADGCVGYHSFAPASADYDVEATIRQISDAGSAGVVGRIDTGADTMYEMRYVAAGTNLWEMRSIVASVTSVLASYGETLSNGNERTAKLEMRGTTIKGYVAGVERTSATDSAISSAGKAGIRMGGGSATNTTRVHLDSWSVTDAAVAAATARLLGLIGCGA